MTSQEKYDVIIIGAGPGGYVAAVRAAQLGMKVACIEKEDRLGGVCLNVGCIPSKALLDSSEYYSLAKNKFSDHGINIKEISIDLDVMMQRKQQVVESLTDSVRQLLEGNKVDVFHGQASLVSETDVAIKSADSASRTITGTNILLATGSRPVEVKGLAFDGQQIVFSTEALSFESIPEHLVVVGGGYIGLELGSVWARLGAKVTVIEMMSSIAGATDGQVSRTLLRILKKQGLQIELNTKVLKAETGNGKVTVFIEKKGKPETLTCDKVLVAVGRQPLTDGLNLKAAGIETDVAGRIVVDESFRTTAKNIYAIGDLIAGPMLAHKASAEGRAAVENMAGPCRRSQLRCHPVGRLYLAGSRLCGLDRRAVKRAENTLLCRDLSLYRCRPGALHGRNRRVCQDAVAYQNRSDLRRSYPRSPGSGYDCRSGSGH